MTRTTGRKGENGVARSMHLWVQVVRVRCWHVHYCLARSPVMMIILPALFYVLSQL
jgi:hypothetical protein